MKFKQQAEAGFKDGFIDGYNTGRKIRKSVIRFIKTVNPIRRLKK